MQNPDLDISAVSELLDQAADIIATESMLRLKNRTPDSLFAKSMWNNSLKIDWCRGYTFVVKAYFVDTTSRYNKRFTYTITHNLSPEELLPFLPMLIHCKEFEALLLKNKPLTDQRKLPF